MEKHKKKPRKKRNSKFVANCLDYGIEF